MDDELTIVAKAEENNLARSIDRLGDTTSLLQDFSDAHAKLVDLLESTTPTNPDVLEVTAMLLMAVRYQLVIGALALLRGHGTDAMQDLRRAVELAAFAYRIHTVPSLKDVWMKADTDPESFAKYRQEFKAQKLFPKEHELLNGLYKRYRHGSGAMHSSIASLAHRARVEVKGGRVIVSQDYFELSEDDESEPARGFLFMIDAHYGILRLFTEVFTAQLAPVREQWDVRMTALSAKLDIHKARWAPKILAKRAAK
jgi:hypothetical protein